MTLTVDTRFLCDPATGRGTLVTAGGVVWELNVAAAVAVTVLSEGGTAAAAEGALTWRWPEIPRDQLHADLTACLDRLGAAGAVTVS